jgi:hypothetical protein
MRSSIPILWPLAISWRIVQRIMGALLEVEMRRCVVILGLFVLCAAGSAPAVVLYDGALNTAPSAQGWRYVTDPLFGASATQSTGGGLVSLDTSAVIDDKAGYFSSFPVLGSHPQMPVLDRAAGYSIDFRARVASETHSSTSRAGFSVIALSSDLKGVELGFWTNEVWAQADSPLFTHAEGAAFNTSAALTDYRLDVVGGQYQLSANDTPILTGLLRDYSSFGFPYNTPSFLFFGDDTSSASASLELARISVNIPEPATAALVAAMAMLHALRRTRRLIIQKP